MCIFKNIKDSIYGPTFYGEVLQKPFWFSMKYFLKFSLLIAVAGAIVLTIIWYPKINDFVDGAGSRVLKFYPQELVVTIKGGMVSTNVKEPYIIDAPEDESLAEGIAMHILVIDTKTPFSVTKFNEYGTAAWLTKDSLMVEDDGSIRVLPLKDIPDYTINYQLAQQVATRIQDVASVIPIFFLPILLFIGIYLLMALHLVYLLVGALVIWLVMKIKNVSMGYGKAYQLGLHAMTLPIILFALLNVFTPWHGFMFDFTIVLVVMTLLNLKNAKTI